MTGLLGPTVDLFGSYFPAWMVCLSAAVPLASGSRLLLLRWKLEADVGPVVLFYPCLLLLFTCVGWLLFF